MSELFEMLSGGDRRSVGRSAEVVEIIQANPALFGEVFEGMLHPDPVVRMRAADAIEKITIEHPEYLQPYKVRLLEEVALVDQQEVRWHVAQLLPRLGLNDPERERAWEILQSYLQDKSAIVRTFSMQALADIALAEPEWRVPLIQQFEGLVANGNPAMQSRGRKLLAKLKKVQKSPA